MFISASLGVSAYSVKKFSIKNEVLAEMSNKFIAGFKKIKKGREPLIQAIKTIWIMFERLEIDVGFADEFMFKVKK